MRKAEAILATTHVTKRGEKFAIEALEMMAATVKEHFVPIGVEHDPRVPPQGRIASAEVRARSDGEYEVAGILELFEADENDSVSVDSREIVIRRNENGLALSYDWTHRHNEDQDDLRSLAEALKAELNYEGKNALEPISVLTLTGTFVLGGIASGLLGQIGADAWDLIKEKLTSIHSRKNLRKGEQLVTVRALIERQGHALEVELIVANPTASDLEVMMSTGLAALDRAVPALIENSPDIRRLVFELKSGDVELLFGVRKDCRPVYANVTVRQILEGENAL